jgi:amino acid transporter
MGGVVIVVILSLFAPITQSRSYVFSHFETSPDLTGIHNKAYAIIISFLVSQYSLYGYDYVAHLIEETRGA